MKIKNKLLYLIIGLVIIICIICIILKINDHDNFKEVNLLSGNIEQTKEYKLYEFGIRENSICKSMDDIVNEVIEKYADDIDFEYVDVTKNITLPNLYSINSVPTFIIVDLNGDVKYRTSGIMTKEELINFINKVNK